MTLLKFSLMESRAEKEQRVRLDNGLQKASSRDDDNDKLFGLDFRFYFYIRRDLLQWGDIAASSPDQVIGEGDRTDGDSAQNSSMLRSTCGLRTPSWKWACWLTAHARSSTLLLKTRRPVVQNPFGS